MRISQSIKTVLFIAASFVIFLAQSAPLDAATAKFYFDTLLTYRIKTSDATAVTHKVTVTNRTPNFTASGMEFYTTSKNIASVRARYSNGDSIPVKVTTELQQSGDIKYKSNKISLKFPKKVFGTGKSFTFTVSYMTNDFVIPKGKTVSKVNIPTVKFSAEDRKYTLRVIAPRALGAPNYSVIGPSESDVDGSNHVISYDKKKLTQSGITIFFGDEAYYRFNLIYPIKNSLPFWKTYFITLPPNLNNQEVFLEKISREPRVMKVDRDGNVIAGYRLNPFEELEVTADVVVRVRFLDYDLSIAGMKDEIPEDIVRTYTKPDRFWETESDAVKQAASQVYSEKKNVAENIRALYDLVIDKLTYNNKKLEFNLRLGAEKTLTQPQNAVCMEFADTLIAMLRASGIPARNPIGYSYDEGLKPSDTVEDSLHSWVEAYVPNVGWIQVDPTWGEKVDNFGKSDFDHVAFSVFGEKPDAPAAVHIGNLDFGYQYEDSIWEFADKVEGVTKAQIDVGNIPLPGFVVSILNIKNLGNSVMYGQEFKLEGEEFYPKNEVKLGTAGPTQVNTYYVLGLAKMFANKPAKVTVSGAPSGTLPEVLADKEFVLPYVLSFVEVALIAVLIILLILRKVYLTIRARKLTQPSKTERHGF